jgi:hypothetical protein
MPDGVARSNDAPRINAGADKMNTISKWALALALLWGPAYGQVPSTNDTSDGYDNTGMGKGALFNVTPGNSGGSSNTAVGFQALYSNTIGYYNTASGLAALYSNTTGFYNTWVSRPADATGLS